LIFKRLINKTRVAWNKKRKIKKSGFRKLYSPPFSRKLRITLQAGLLAHPVLTAFPSRSKRTVAGFAKTLHRTYSYGDSPGFTPGSLLIHLPMTSERNL
jgi:hypothetical protein